MKQKSNDYIAIPAILKVENGALTKIGAFLKESDFKKVVIFFGNGLIEMFGNTVMESLRSADIEVLEYQELDSIRLEDINSLAFRQSSVWAAEKSLMQQNIADFYVNCPLSVSPPLPPAMDFPVPVHPF